MFFAPICVSSLRSLDLTTFELYYQKIGLKPFSCRIDCRKTSVMERSVDLPISCPSLLPGYFNTGYSSIQLIANTIRCYYSIYYLLLSYYLLFRLLFTIYYYYLLLLFDITVAVTITIHITILLFTIYITI